jgi:hypothetical protein
MVVLGVGVTIVTGPPLRAATDGVILAPLAGQNLASLCAVPMESNPNPTLKSLLEIARGSGQAGGVSRGGKVKARPALCRSVRSPDPSR